MSNDNENSATPVVIKAVRILTDILKRGRKAKGLTQEEMAKALRISRTSAVMMERDADALGSTSFMTVLKALRLAGYELSITPIAKARNIDEINADNKAKSQSSLPSINKP